MVIRCSDNSKTLTQDEYLQHPEKNWELIKQVWNRSQPLVIDWDGGSMVFEVGDDIVFKCGDCVHPIGYQRLTKSCFERISDVIWHQVFGCPIWK